MTADEELWFDEDVEPLEVEPLEVEPLDVEPLESEPLDEDESSLEDVVPELDESSLEVALAVVAVSD